MMLGKGAVYATSTRQKLNTKSSTEAELVAVDDILSQVLWTRYFLKAQGYDVTESTVYQDNQSAILLENNGKASSSKRTRHINIRYYFVKDKITNKEVRIEYCPTNDMIADFFTKPLQGMLFKKFRSMIMNIKELHDVTDKIDSDPGDEHHQDHRSVLWNDNIKPGYDAKPGHTDTDPSCNRNDSKPGCNRNDCNRNDSKPGCNRNDADDSMDVDGWIAVKSKKKGRKG
jgi:hypothetical protein